MRPAAGAINMGMPSNSSIVWYYRTKVSGGRAGIVSVLLMARSLQLLDVLTALSRNDAGYLRIRTDAYDTGPTQSDQHSPHLSSPRRGRP